MNEKYLPWLMKMGWSCLNYIFDHFYLFDDVCSSQTNSSWSLNHHVFNHGLNCHLSVLVKCLTSVDLWILRMCVCERACVRVCN